jgi:hypothetical protein
MQTNHQRAGAAEQTKRRAFKKDVRVSKALGISTEQVLERREQAVVDWMSRLTEKDDRAESR